MRRCLTFVATLLFFTSCPAAAQPSLLMPTNSTLPAAVPQVEKSGAWPADVPLPNDISNKVSIQTKSRFEGRLRTEQPRAALVDFYNGILPQQGWTVDTVHKERSFFQTTATDPTRELTVRITRFRRAEEVQITVQQKDAACGTESEEPEARVLLERMRQAYMAAESYADQGLCRGVIKVSEEVTEYAEPVAFSTAFVRSSKFRYEVVNMLDRNIVHEDEKGIRSYWPVRANEENPVHLAEAVSDLSSIPAKATALFPGLLIKGVAGSLPPLSQARIVGKETIKGAACSVVECRDDACLPVRFWIGDADAMVRRFESYGITPELVKLDVMEIDPALNVPIPDDALELNKNGQLELLDPIAPSTLEQLLQSVTSLFW